MTEAAQPEEPQSSQTLDETTLEVDHEIARAVSRQTSRFLPGVSGLLLVEALYDGLVHGLERFGPEAVMLTLSAAMIVYLGSLENQRRTLPISSRTLAVIMVMLSLAVQLAHLWLLADPAYYLPFVVALFGAGYYALAPTALGVALGVSVAAWAAASAIYQGAALWIPLTAAAALIAAQSVKHAARMIDDIVSSRKSRIELSVQLEREKHHLEASQRKWGRERQAIEAATDGHWHWDLTTDTCYFSEQWARMLEFEPSEISERPDEWLSRVHSHYLPQVKEDLSAHLYGRTPRFESQFRIQTRGGAYLWALARGGAQRDAEGNPLSISGSLIDINHLVQAEKALINDAFEDRLTGLANRKAFTIRLERAVERMQEDHYLFAVIFMDLDRFKVINDSHGHLFGDHLLSAVASRLRNCLRERRGDILARFGGDEFVALLEDLKDPDDALVIARRFQDVLRSPFKIGDHEIVSGGSIGIAYNNTRIEKAADLLRNADTAMYRAKGARKGEIQVFNTEMYEETVRLYALENDLGRALDRNEFVLEYQPVVSLRCGSIVGAEALLRWRRSDGELVGPAEFIPLAEETGNIEAIGEWALTEAVRQNREWQTQGLTPVKIAVNLSAKQLQRPGLVNLVGRVLKESKLRPSWLELELTETALMENLEQASNAIAALQRAGVRVSIDDFGTGYSSLGYLRRFSFDSLKMDRSFVADMTADPKSLAVAKGLIRLAHNLKLKVTAEGVETREQLDYLRRFGCDQFQGYLASRPVSAERFSRMLRDDEHLVAALAPMNFAESSADLRVLGEALGKSIAPTESDEPSFAEPEADPPRGRFVD